MAVIATIAGTGLRVGASKNRRYYSRELISKAVLRAQQRLRDDGRPLTMRVAHPDPEVQQFAPVTETAGRITSVRQDSDGSMRFTAELYDTSAGRDVLALYDTRGQKPALKNVSIRGRWLGAVTPTVVDGLPCEAAEDLELDGIDFTHLPGVDGAEVDQVAAPGAALESATSGTPIYESCEEMHVTETVTETPPATLYADLGYLPDGKQRWPLGTASEARTAWAALYESAIADQYTAKQLKRVRDRAAKALRGHGVEVRRNITEGAGPVLVQRGTVTEDFNPFTVPGEFYVRLDNGAVCVTVSSCSIDPHDLGRIGTAAMSGAVQALLAMDPDDDGDIDVPGAPYQDTDRDMGDEDDATETVEAADGVQPESVEPLETPASTEDADTTTESEAPEMSDATQAATTEAAPTETPAALAAAPLTLEALTAFGTAMGEALAAKLAPAPAVEAAPVVEKPAEVEKPAVESEDERIARLVAEALAKRDTVAEAERTKLLQTEVAAGRTAPARKGLVGRVNESGRLDLTGDTNVAEGVNEHGLPTKWVGDKAPHQLVGEQRNVLSGLLFEHVMGNR